MGATDTKTEFPTARPDLTPLPDFSIVGMDRETLERELAAAHDRIAKLEQDREAEITKREGVLLKWHKTQNERDALREERDALREELAAAKREGTIVVNPNVFSPTEAGFLLQMMDTAGVRGVAGVKLAATVVAKLERITLAAQIVDTVQAAVPGAPPAAE